MKNQILQEIKNSLNDMKKAGVVETSVPDKLNSLWDLLETIKTKWLKDSNTDGFYFYQAARNVELILGRMTDRFANSKTVRDNQKIIKDSLFILPVIDRVLKTTETDKINKDTIDMVLRCTEELRKMAISAELIETIDSSRGSMKAKDVKRRLGKLMKTLDKS